MLTNILIIPFHPPNKIDASAGSKTSTYYLSQFSNDPTFNIRVLTFKVGTESISKINNVKIDWINIRKDTTERLKRAFFELRWQINPFDKSAGHYYGYREKMIIRKLKELKQSYTPDIVILEWTESILYIDVIKRLYPKAKSVGFVHDVCFQKIGRELQYLTPKYFTFFMRIRAIRFKKFEIDSYNKCDKLIVQNNKDENLLVNEGISKNQIEIISPFYEDMSECKPKFTDKILFWGDLSRPENYKACIWFIENVFNVLKKSLPLIKFVIAGKNPPKELYSYQNNDIILTGFVKDLNSTFEDAFCSVVPLYLGAGIKVKILESMSASLPVLTGHVGIEGIEAINGQHYIHCDTPQQYIEAITLFFENKKLAKAMGEASRNFIMTKFSIKKSALHYKNTLKSLAKLTN